MRQNSLVWEEYLINNSLQSDALRLTAQRVTEWDRKREILHEREGKKTTKWVGNDINHCGWKRRNHEGEILMHIIWEEICIPQTLSKTPPDIWQVGTISVVGANYYFTGALTLFFFTTCYADVLALKAKKSKKINREFILFIPVQRPEKRIQDFKKKQGTKRQVVQHLLVCWLLWGQSGYDIPLKLPCG